METRQAELWTKCPDGHRKAALQYLTYGIIPTMPCPECGETFTFDGLTMSLDFQSNEPAQGIGGKVYQLCPKCGDDMPQLQGTDPVGWGWGIVCAS